MLKQTTILVTGDAFAIAAITMVGFATHGEGDLSFLPRMFAVFIPLAIAWFLLAPWFRLFQPEITSSPKQLWRLILVMFFATPFAVILRGLILNAAIIPIFAIVLSAVSAFGMLIWRGIYLLYSRSLRA